MPNSGRMSTDSGGVDPLEYDAEHDTESQLADDSIGQAADEVLPDLPDDDGPRVRDWDHSRPIGPDNPIES